VKRYAIISLSAFLLSLFFSFLGIVVFNKQAQGAILARTLAIAIVVLITLIIQLSKGHVTFKMSFFTNSLQIGFPIFIYLIIGQLSVNIDRITVERVLSLRELGIYGIAITITTVVEIWITSVSNTTSPMIYKMFKNDTQENEQKVASILKWQFVSVLFVICILILMVTPVVRLMISKGYHDCIDLVPILALSFIGRILYISFVPVIFNLKKTKALAAINIFTLIVSIGVSWILAIYMGLIGIAIGTVISKFIPVPFVYFYSRKLHKMGYDMTAPYVLSVLIILATIIGIILKNTIGYYLAYSIPFLIFFPASLFLFRNEITLIKNHLLNHIKKQQ
jgi:O-antigen/teichoic acid export membrane protein